MLELMRLLITLPQISTLNSSDVDDSLVRHEQYYFRDSEMAIFKVEDRLFKVHRHFFIRESEIFESMFSCPPGPHGDQDGHSDKRPIHLPEVTCAEFEALLDFFYHGMFDKQVNIVLGLSGLLGSDSLDHQRLEGSKKMLDLLSISLRYAFDDVIKEILAAVDIRGDRRVDPVPRILLAIKHDVLRHWLLPTFQELLRRPVSLSKEEIQQLGPSKAAIISRKREEAMCSARGFPFPNSPGAIEEILDENAIPIEFFIEN